MGADAGLVGLRVGSSTRRFRIGWVQEGVSRVAGPRGCVGWDPGMGPVLFPEEGSWLGPGVVYTWVYISAPFVVHGWWIWVWPEKSRWVRGWWVLMSEWTWTWSSQTHHHSHSKVHGAHWTTRPSVPAAELCPHSTPSSPLIETFPFCFPCRHGNSHSCCLEIITLKCLLRSRQETLAKQQ